MEGGGGAAERVADGARVAQVGDGGVQAAAVAAGQPVEVALDAGAAEVVEDEDVPALFEQRVGQVAADETATAEDDGVAGRTADGGRAHATNPRASSWRLASSPFVVGGLGADPVGEFAHGVFEEVRGLEAEQGAGLGDVGEAVADVALARLAEQLRAQMRDLHGAGEDVGDVGHRVGVAAADIDDVAGGVGMFHGKAEGAGDVAYMDEVPLLLAVLEDEGTFAVEEASAEIGEHAGVGVRESLAGAEDVEEAERHRVDAVGAADDEAVALLDVFGDGVDGGEVGGFGFVGGDRVEGFAVGGGGVPAVHVVRKRAADVSVALAVGGGVEAFAVDAHRGGDDDAAGFRRDQALEKDGGAEVVGADIARDLVHALAHTHLGGEVEDAVDVLQGLVEQGGVADVAFEELDVWVQIGRGIGMDLVDQAVYRADLVALGQEFFAEMTADETRAAGDEIVAPHGTPCSNRSADRGL